MPHVAIETVIMIPLLVLQIFLLPMVATTMTSYWTDNSRQVAVQDAANQLADVIQQLYISLNRKEVLNGTIRWTSTLPEEVASYPYMANGSLRTSLGSNSSKILTLQVHLQIVGSTATASVTFGSNVVWNQTSVFDSDSLNAAIEVKKFADGTLRFSFK
jgi:hypothetical protein